VTGTSRPDVTETGTESQRNGARSLLLYQELQAMLGGRASSLARPHRYDWKIPSATSHIQGTGHRANGHEGQSLQSVYGRLLFERSPMKAFRHERNKGAAGIDGQS